MLLLFNTVILLNILAFAVYGCLAIFSNHMVDEFERYGLAKFRVLVGILEVLGATGQLVGLFFAPFLVAAASAGLSLLMLLGVATRIRIGDPIPLILPAMILMIINGAICAASLL
jgi:hypothetical protein